MVFSWPSKNNKGRSSQIFCYKCLECLSPRVKLRMIWCGSVLQLMTVQCCLSLTAILGLVLLRSTISGWLVFFFYLGKTVFSQFGWSFLKPGWNSWKSVNLCNYMNCLLHDCSSDKHHSKELLCFNWERFEKCSTERHKQYQPKPVCFFWVNSILL